MKLRLFCSRERPLRVSSRLNLALAAALLLGSSPLALAGKRSAMDAFARQRSFA
jgi:hypothetical protein